MRNGFGLKLLHKFFNLPFLQLQKETLLKQLERNDFEIKATVQELDVYGESDEANYNKFLDNLTKRRREIADSNSNVPPQIQLPSSVSAQNVSQSSMDNMMRSQSASIIIGAGKPIPFNPANGSFLNRPTTSNAKTTKTSSQNNFLTKFGVKFDVVDGEYPDVKKLEINPITSVEEFCPDGGQIDRSFLDDVHFSPQINHIELDESDR